MKRYEYLYQRTKELQEELTSISLELSKEVDADSIVHIGEDGLVEFPAMTLNQEQMEGFIDWLTKLYAEHLEVANEVANEDAPIETTTAIAPAVTVSASRPYRR